VDGERKATRPDEGTREFEDSDAHVRAGPDDMPTREDEEAAERAGFPGPEVAENYEEAIERGANQRGEGRIP
jgi:hypothetical protein